MKHINHFTLQYRAALAARRFAKQFRHRALVLARLGTMPKSVNDYLNWGLEMEQRVHRLAPLFRHNLRPPGRITTLIQ